MKNRTDHALAEHLPAWGVLILESHHSDQFTMEWRKHDFLKIVYVFRGSGKFYLDQELLEFGPGDVIVVPPNLSNRIVDDPDLASSLYVCCVAPEIWQFDPTIPDQLSVSNSHHNVQFTQRIAKVMRRMIHHQSSKTAHRPIQMVSDAIKIMAYLIAQNQESINNSSSENSDRVKVEQYIESLPSIFFEEQSMDQACRTLGIPRRSFTKHFHAVAGTSWLKHVRKLAIEHAKRRLAQTQLPVTSIAFECGFNDLSTFYRQFKQQCGITPRDYRKQYQFDSSIKYKA